MNNDIMSYDRPALTADCVLFTTYPKLDGSGWNDLSLQVRLVCRENAPENGKWGLLGAFVNIDERVEDAMRRAVASKGGIHDNFYAEQLATFDTPGRDERWRVVSVTYLGIQSQASENPQKADEAYWFYVDMDAKTLYQPLLDIEISFDELAFDHGEILDCACQRLRAKATYSDIALLFLGDLFTIADIKAVMEAICGKTVNNVGRTFAEVIIEDMLEAPDENGKRPARRPSQMYKRKANNENVMFRLTKTKREQV